MRHGISRDNFMLNVMRHIRDKLYETLNTNCYESNWLAVKRFILD